MLNLKYTKQLLMNSNKVFKNIQNFVARDITLRQFQDLLESSTRSNPIRVKWETQEGNQDYYWMWWEDGPLGTTARGDAMSATKEAEGMFNIQTFEQGKWRTLDLQTVSQCRFENKIYYVK
jgi:hypothetical protein